MRLWNQARSRILACNTKESALLHTAMGKVPPHSKTSCCACLGCQLAPASRHSVPLQASIVAMTFYSSFPHSWLLTLHSRMIMSIIIIPKLRWRSPGSHRAYPANTRSISSTPATSPPASSTQHRTRLRGSSQICKPETLFLSPSARRDSL